jgi:8-oxo-dGTP diphosphatase
VGVTTPNKREQAQTTMRPVLSPDESLAAGPVGGRSAGLPADQMTICIMLKGDHVLLKEATRGKSKGKVTFPGGSLNQAESVMDCLRREVAEETGFELVDPFHHGFKECSYGPEAGRVDRVHIFSTSIFRGDPLLISDDNGALWWCHRDRLPAGRMWLDTQFWFDRVYERDRFWVRAHYGDRTGSSLLHLRLESADLMSEDGSRLNRVNGEAIREFRSDLYGCNVSVVHPNAGMLVRNLIRREETIRRLRSH